jgi:hypothetical protein
MQVSLCILGLTKFAYPFTHVLRNSPPEIPIGTLVETVVAAKLCRTHAESVHLGYYA